jgi:putative FmdB family regulatory protein
MPLYEYCCPTCRKRFEVLQRMGESPQAVRCPECGGSEVERQLSTFAATVSSGSIAPEPAGCGEGACGTGFT